MYTFVFGRFGRSPEGQGDGGLRASLHGSAVDGCRAGPVTRVRRNRRGSPDVRRRRVRRRAQGSPVVRVLQLKLNDTHTHKGFLSAHPRVAFFKDWIGLGFLRNFSITLINFFFDIPKND